MAKKIFKLSKEDVYWKLKQGLKNKVIQQCENILNDPSATHRAKGIAIKNILAINNQNISLCDDVKQNDNQLSIKIVHEDQSPNKEIESPEK